MNVKNLFLIILLVIFFGNAKAQSVAYYPFNSVLSVSTNPENTFWLDARFQTNSFFTSLSTEIAPAINLNKNRKGRFYLGGGGKFNFLAYLEDNARVFDGFFFNFGVRSAPIEKLQALQFAFELSPFVAADFESGIFRTRLGVAYNFSHKEEK